MDSDGEDEGMEFMMTLSFLEDMAVISNVNVCINAKWLLCLQAPTHVSGEYRSSSSTLIYHCLKAQRLHSNCELFPSFIYSLDSYGAERIFFFFLIRLSR